MSAAVSVLLPVYNCPGLVGEAIESILNQTWLDFELIVIDDGSIDETPSVLARYYDPRIRLVRQDNKGLAAALNRGIELAQGRYLARQDQDDISYPARLAKQVAFLEGKANCGLVGTWAEIRDENATSARQHRHPASNSQLKFDLLLNNPFVHSSVMIRRSALDRVGAYSVDPARQPPEDYELWSRIARHYDVANIPEVLHIYREVQGSMSRDGASPFVERLIKISAENIGWAAKVDSRHPQVINIASLMHGALDHVIEKPDLRLMTDIFREAAQRVVATEDRERFCRQAERKIDALRFSYPELFGTSLLKRKLTGLARRAAALLQKAS